VQVPALKLPAVGRGDGDKADSHAELVALDHSGQLTKVP
jgi:hypothetical protein